MSFHTRRVGKIEPVRRNVLLDLERAKAHTDDALIGKVQAAVTQLVDLLPDDLPGIDLLASGSITRGNTGSFANLKLEITTVSLCE